MASEEEMDGGTLSLEQGARAATAVERRPSRSARAVLGLGLRAFRASGAYHPPRPPARDDALPGGDGRATT